MIPITELTERPLEEKQGTLEDIDTITSVIREHPDWQIHDEDAYESGISKPQFTNRDTEETLVMKARETSKGSGEYWEPELILNQRLHSVQYLTTMPTGESFKDNLSRVYQQLEEEHGSDYTKGPTTERMGMNGFYPASAEIPFDYDEAKIDAALDSLSDISREVGKLHLEIQEPIERRLE